MHRVNGAALTDPVHAADPLRQPQRAPRPLQHHDQTRGILEVQAFPGYIGRQQYAGASFREAGQPPASLRRVELAMQQRHRRNVLERLPARLQRVAKLAEDDGRFAGAPEEWDQAFELRCVPFGPRGSLDQAPDDLHLDLAIQEVGRAQNPGPNYQIIIGESAFGNFYKELNPQIVPMIGQATSEIDPGKRDAAYKAIQKAIYDDNVEFPIYFRELIWGVRKRVTGFQGRVGGDTRVYYCGVT